MNTRVNTYREVEKLPASAMSVSAYAEREGIGACQVYKRWKKQQKPRVYKLKNQTEPFEIVVFQNFNFVIPGRKPKEAAI